MLIRTKKKQVDLLNRNKINQSESKRVYYRFMRLISALGNNLHGKIKYQYKLATLPKVRFNNYCYLTGRGRGVQRNFKLSRHQIKDKFKYLHGLVNSSW